MSAVQSISSYLERQVHGEDEELRPASTDTTAEKSIFGDRLHTDFSAASSQQGAPEDAMCGILEQVVRELIAHFHTTQVQVCLSASYDWYPISCHKREILRRSFRVSASALLVKSASSA